MPEVNKLFGIDIDDIFKLAAPKYVYVRDAKLGILKYLLMVGILFYILGYNILYCCSHLIPQVATGYGSITLMHPVESCDHGECTPAYKNIALLPYCSESALVESRRLLDMDDDVDGDGTADEGGAKSKIPVGTFISPAAECRYLDNDRLTMEEVPNELFVPMRYVSYQQEMADGCYDPAAHVHGHHIRDPSKSHFQCRKSWQTKNRSEFYVADLERFTLTMTHSFMAPAIGMAGVSTGMAGFFKSCGSSHPTTDKECFKMKIPGTNYGPKQAAPEDLEDAHNPEHYNITTLIGTAGGLDRISMGDLLKLTPVANKMNWQSDIPDRKLPDDMGHPKHSLREVGGLLMLSVSYANTGYKRPGFPGIDLPGLYMGAIKPITYTYRPYFIPSNHNKKVEVLFKSDTSTKRTVNIWFGMTVKLSFEGSLTQFSITQLLTTLTTALVLLSSATTIVTYLALYLLPASEKYTLMMYQYTEDFSDYEAICKARKEAKAKDKTSEKCPVSSPTGYVLGKAHAKSEPRLNEEEILSVLTDYEIRLNRLDGVDPELAFPANPTTIDIKDQDKFVMTLYNRNAAFRQRFQEIATTWTKDFKDRDLRSGLLADSQSSTSTSTLQP